MSTYFRASFSRILGRSLWANKHARCVRGARFPPRTSACALFCEKASLFGAPPPYPTSQRNDASRSISEAIAHPRSVRRGSSASSRQASADLCNNPRKDARLQGDGRTRAYRLRERCQPIGQQSDASILVRGTVPAYRPRERCQPIGQGSDASLSVHTAMPGYRSRERCQPIAQGCDAGQLPSLH